MRGGHDPNELEKTELFSDLINRLYERKLLNETLMANDSSQVVTKSLLEGQDRKYFNKSKVLNVIEFGRIIHAEMSAITDAARNGLSTKGGILYCTTFPCHICAKHIVASGISKVVFLEPYPKSYAAKLHEDSIQVESIGDFRKVSFMPFMGISPFRYRDLFEKGRRKDDLGKAEKWKNTPPRPMFEIIKSSNQSSHSAETLVASRLGVLLAEADKDIQDQDA